MIFLLLLMQNYRRIKNSTKKHIIEFKIRKLMATMVLTGSSIWLENILNPMIGLSDPLV